MSEEEQRGQCGCRQKEHEGRGRHEVERRQGKACGGHVGHNKAVTALEWELFMVLSGNVHDLTFLKYHIWWEQTKKWRCMKMNYSV